MYQIGEFSKIVGMTVKTLRYYDEIDLLCPAFKNEENGYRYYNNDNYENAIWIKVMKKYNFSIKEIQEALPNIKCNDDLADFLLEKQDQIQLQILSMKQLHKNIATEVSVLKEVRDMKNKQSIEIITIPNKLVASITYVGRYDELGKYLGVLFKHVGAKGISEPFTIYHDETYMEENATVEVCLEVKSPIKKGDVVTKELEGGKYASLLHIGPYEALSESYKDMMDYIKENKLALNGPAREIYLKGPGMLFKGNPQKYETQILFPIV